MLYLSIGLILFLTIMIVARKQGDPITGWTPDEWVPVIAAVLLWPVFIIFMIGTIIKDNLPPMDIKAFFFKERHIKLYDFNKVIREYKEIKRKRLLKEEAYRKLFRLKRMD